MKMFLHKIPVSRTFTQFTWPKCKIPSKSTHARAHARTHAQAGYINQPSFPLCQESKHPYFENRFYPYIALRLEIPPRRFQTNERLKIGPFTRPYLFRPLSIFLDLK